jgi:two-component system sensor histidine kinase MtrB
MSRYDAGAVALEVDEVNIVPLVEDCLDQLGPLAEQKGSDLVLEVRGGYGECEVDQRRLRRIVLNFVGNAIDHGEGKPIVTFIDSNEEAVSIAVRDWGVGMKAEEVDRVFDRFWRADPSRQRTTGGTGLGLAIATEDATAHGGRIDVWSKPGEGSCFRLTVPRSPLASWSLSPLPLPPDVSPASGEIVVDSAEEAVR